MEELFEAAVAAELALGRWLLEQPHTFRELKNELDGYRTFMVDESDLRVTVDRDTNMMTANRSGFPPRMCAVNFPHASNGEPVTWVPQPLLRQMGIL